MQIWGNGPWHCRAVSHRSAASAGAPSSALHAIIAASNTELDVNDPIMIPSAAKNQQWPLSFEAENNTESQAATARPQHNHLFNIRETSTIVADAL
jgi:hypothetical protein